MLKKSGAVSQQIADELRARILSGALPPGTRIRQEQIAEEFGVSRLPIREALRIVESQGLVTLVAATGAWVSSMDLGECQETYLIRERLEPLALGLSVKHMSGETIERLEELARRIEGSASAEEFMDLDRQFHLLSVQDAGMGRLLEMVERQWNTTQHYRRAYVQLTGTDGLQETHLEHRLLVAAIRRRDSRSAEELLGMHIRKTRIALEDHPEIFDH
ncbi:GntR family transcriptional regulator [Sinomonas sp. ASV486]|uniref:GntR family transcriptional regulator n=1 Tax=Sinomonas sp. ASV486 TaxID=3051170 RepID=UPI0027DD51D2|nr:GntR family transcriptional regulator [Sinomonas sp. ASV486]MDQ4490799.1 GntR family transcriptional regulator [Sinomonas sp. ASV486]